MTKLTEETFKCDDDQTNDLVKFYTRFQNVCV